MWAQPPGVKVNTTGVPWGRCWRRAMASTTDADENITRRFAGGQHRDGTCFWMHLLGYGLDGLENPKPMQDDVALYGWKKVQNMVAKPSLPKAMIEVSFHCCMDGRCRIEWPSLILPRSSLGEKHPSMTTAKIMSVRWKKRKK